MKNWSKLLRMKHWTKNALVLFPLLFSGRLCDPADILKGMCAFVAFCLLSSAIYIVNDVRDIEADRVHPRKRMRPLVSGAISVQSALIVSAALAIAGFALTGIMAEEGWQSLLLLGLYALLNLCYSLGLKNIAVIDIAILASGFLIRVLFGGEFCGIDVSSWLFLTVLALAFYFALGKRRGELARNGTSARKSLRSYTPAFLDKNMYVFLACGLVFYSLWTFARIGDFGAYLDFSSVTLVMGIPCAMLVCLRYSLDVESEESDGDPIEVVLGDRALLFLIFCWVVVMMLGLYLGGGDN